MTTNLTQNDVTVSHHENQKRHISVAASSWTLTQEYISHTRIQNRFTDWEFSISYSSINCADKFWGTNKSAAQSTVCHSVTTQYKTQFLVLILVASWPEVSLSSQQLDCFKISCLQRMNLTDFCVSEFFLSFLLLWEKADAPTKMWF